MGSGVTKFATSDSPVWTEQEIRENEAALKYQRECADKIAEHYYYGMPVKAKKESNDPLSPLWIQVDQDAIQNFHSDNGKSEDLGQSNFGLSPTIIMVDGKGFIVIIFDRENVKLDYRFHFNDFKHFSDSIRIPEPPKIKDVSQTSILLCWTYPEPKGIAQICEIQFSLISEKELLDDDYQYNCKWNACVTKRFEFPNFDTFSFDNLSPGQCFIFRIRYRNLRDWSGYSEASDIMTTLPSSPSAPNAPVLAGN